MGNVITNQAGTEHILSDVLVTAARCRGRGGEWAAEGHRWLGDVVALVELTATELPALDQAAADAVAARDAAIASARARVAWGYDRMWNLCGRARRDAWLAILFPGGADCTDGRIDHRARKMEVVAESLALLGHPRVDAGTCAEIAADIGVAAAVLRERIEAAGAATARRDMNRQVRKALGLVGQAQLVSLKRALANHRFREAEIHQVIPDRPRKPARSTAGSDADRP